MYARLLLCHLPARVAVLRRLWDAVVPGGHLVVQDYDVRTVDALPALESVEELTRVMFGGRLRRACRARLPELFAQAGIGTRDGTDMAGRLERLADVQALFTGVYSGVLSTATRTASAPSDKLLHGTLRSHTTSSASLTGPALWPLLIAPGSASPRKRAHTAARGSPRRSSRVCHASPNVPKVRLDVPALEAPLKDAKAAQGARVDAALARLGEPGAGTGGEAGVEGSTPEDKGMEVKAQLDRMAAANPASVVNLSSGSPDRFGSDPEDRLAKLADLKERGVLSDEEFAAEKAKILSES